MSAGAPIGRFAWGGQHDILPACPRLGSAVSFVLAVLLLLVAVG